MAYEYIASEQIKVSTANEELIPPKPEGWSRGYIIRKLSFDNVEACTIKLNNKTRIFLGEGKGFEIGYDDPSLTSFIIEEEGITYTFIASY